MCDVSSLGSFRCLKSSLGGGGVCTPWAAMARQGCQAVRLGVPTHCTCNMVVGNCPRREARHGVGTPRRPARRRVGGQGRDDCVDLARPCAWTRWFGLLQASLLGGIQSLPLGTPRLPPCSHGMVAAPLGNKAVVARPWWEKSQNFYIF